MPKVTVTFEGDCIVDAMQNACIESGAFLKAMSLAEEHAVASGAYKPEEKGNGEAKEDIVISEDAPMENNAILASALDLLMTIYGAKDDPTQEIPAPSTAVSSLLVKYGVDNLHEVPVERASELFADAKELATTYGVSN